MSKNLILSSLLSALMVAIIALVAVPKMLDAMDYAKGIVQSQNENHTSYTGAGVVVDLQTSPAGCSVEIIGDPGLVSVDAGSCTGIQIGDTVKVQSGSIR